jgi:hypothetical protein
LKEQNRFGPGTCVRMKPGICPVSMTGIFRGFHESFQAITVIISPRALSFIFIQIGILPLLSNFKHDVMKAEWNGGKAPHMFTLDTGWKWMSRLTMRVEYFDLLNKS